MMSLDDTKIMESYIKDTSPTIATRTLFYSGKNSGIRHRLIIILHAPIRLNNRLAKNEDLQYLYASYVDFNKICRGFLFYGYDEFQAIEFSVAVDLILKEKQDKYDFYFTKTGDTPYYFDDW